MNTRSVLLLACALACTSVVGLLGFRLARASAPVKAAATATREKTNFAKVKHAVKPNASGPWRSRVLSEGQAGGVQARAWAQETGVATLDEFRAWTERYAAAPDATAKRTLQTEGVALARARHALLKELIRSDPEMALALTVPAGISAQLPDEVVSWLERRVSGVGRLDVRHADWLEGDQLRCEVARTATLGEVTYAAYVYGQREKAVPLVGAYLNGIAIDGDLAVSESPFRVLEAGERATALLDFSASKASARGGEIVAQIGETFVAFAQEEELRAAEKRLYQLESAYRPTTEVSLAEVLDPARDGSILASETDRSLGPKRAIVVRVDFPDLPGEPTFAGEVWTASRLQTVSTEEVAPFFAECSLGRTSLEFTVAPKLYRLARPTSVYTQNVMTTGSSALQSDAYAAVGGDYDLNSFDHVILIFSGLAGYPSGMAGGHDIWMNGLYRFSVVAHELGHNYGWGHANAWFGASHPLDYAAGMSWEYGDPFDVMGAGSFPESFGFGVATMATFGWINAEQIATATTDSTYRIHASNRKGLSPTGTPLLGVKIRQDATHDYWISFRSPTEASYGGYAAGAHVARVAANARQSDVIVLNNPDDVAYSLVQRANMLLPLGGAFSDAAAGVSVQVVAHGGTGREQYVDVKVSFSPTAIAPEVGIQPSDQLGVRIGASARFATWARAGQPQATYRWQRQRGGVGTWNDLTDSAVFSGSTAPTLLISATASDMEGDKFRCRVENAAGSVLTDEARLTVVNVTAGSFTLAGRLGMAGYADGSAAVAQFAYPMGIARAADGSLYVSDARNNRMRRVAADGTVSTVAMDVATPRGVCFDAAGNLYVADENASVIRKYSAAGGSSIHAGQLWTPGSIDGDHGTARLRAPNGLAIDAAGNLYVADTVDQTVRKISAAGAVSTLAGTPGVSGYIDGPGATARFNFISYQGCGVAVGPDGAIYVTDSGNHCVRRIGLDREVTTVAGSPARQGAVDGGPSHGSMDAPIGLTFDANGILYVVDSSQSNIRAISPDGYLYTIAGGWGSGEGVGTAFGLRSPQALVLGPDGRLYIADANNSAIRVYVPTGPAVVREPTDAVEIGVGGGAVFAVDVTGAWPLPQFRWQQRYSVPTGTDWNDVVDGEFFEGASSGQLVATGVSSRVAGLEFRCVVSNPKGSVMSRAAALTVASRGIFTLAGAPTNTAVRDGLLNEAGMTDPRSFVLLPDGALAFIDGYYLMRVLRPSGEVVPGPQKTAVNASGLARDAAGNLYFSDQYQHSVRKVSPSGTVELIAGANDYNASGAVDGLGTAARFKWPTRIASTPGGTLYVFDSGSYTVRAITPAGQVTTLAGLAGISGTQDGLGAGARLSYITAMAMAPDGNLIVRDASGRVVRRITPDGVVTTVAGAAGYGSFDGPGAVAGINADDGGLAVGPDGTIYLAERLTGKIRMISAAGFVTTLRDREGTPVIFSQPSGLAVDAAGTLYVGDAARHTISGYVQPPQIVRSPASVATQPGATVTLSVDATGTVDAHYQWSRNGLALPGETSAQLVIATVSAATAGDYIVEVSNRGGYRRSDTATVSMTQAQTITFAALPDRNFTRQAVALSASASSGRMVSFSVVSGPASVSGNMLTLNGVGTVVVRATQAGDGQFAAAVAVDRSFVVRASYASWQQECFTPEQLNDPTVAGLSSDPDHDGMVNLLEYAFVLDPLASEMSGALPEVGTSLVEGESHLTLTFRRRKGAADLGYAVEDSSNLIEWARVVVTETSVVDHGDWEMVTVRDPAGLSAEPARFLRLRVQTME